MAAEAFFRNDPYFPRPLSSNPHEQPIYEEEIRELLERFIETVERIMKERLAKKLEAEKRLAAMGPENGRKAASRALGRERYGASTLLYPWGENQEKTWKAVELWTEFIGCS
ncbi:hypothetical protein MMC24_001091 [Lignoscripta atroalba]|nr:hypothetical protein [Lignoscripta atroalba]